MNAAAVKTICISAAKAKCREEYGPVQSLPEILPGHEKPNKRGFCPTCGRKQVQCATDEEKVLWKSNPRALPLCFERADWVITCEYEVGEWHTWDDVDKTRLIDWPGRTHWATYGVVVEKSGYARATCWAS